MNMQEVIAHLQKMEFVCVDVNKEDEEVFGPFPEGRSAVMDMGIKKSMYVSLKSKELVDVAETGSYLDYHAAAHRLMLDKLIGYLATNTGDWKTIKFLVNETLRCAEDKNKDVIDFIVAARKDKKSAKVKRERRFYK